jgi:hypothetical protein
MAWKAVPDPKPTFRYLTYLATGWAADANAACESADQALQAAVAKAKAATTPAHRLKGDAAG